MMYQIIDHQVVVNRFNFLKQNLKLSLVNMIKKKYLIKGDQKKSLIKIED